MRTAEAEGTFQIKGWRFRKDDSRFWASVVIDPIYSADRRLLGFAKITRDISDRKASEEALRKSEQEFRLLVQGVTDYAIFMLDPQGRVTNWNAGAQKIKGYAPTEVLGSHFSRFYTPEDQASKLPERALATALADGKFEQEGWRVRKDGSRFLAHVVIDPLRDAEGNFIGFAKITRDVTERREVEEALKLAERALLQSQKMETIGKLTGGVAHDFNNLLQVIAGNLQLLSRDVAGNERAERRVQSAIAGVRRGAKLAGHLLAFGRRQTLKPKVVNLGRLVASMDDMFQRALGETVQIQTTVAKDLWNTSADLAQVENALLNLVINARDAMNEVGQLTIEIGNAVLDEAYARAHAEVEAGEYVLLAVSDTGSGMAPDVLAQAFDPFYDLLFTDVVMPGSVPSPELARQAREHLPGIAVLFTSGYTRNAIVHGGRLDPGVELLSKPYSREDLARKIRNALKKS